MIEALGHLAESLAARLLIRRIDQFAVEPRAPVYLRHTVKSAPFKIWITSDLDPSRVDAPWISELATVNVPVGVGDVAVRREAWRAELGRLNHALEEDALRVMASDYPLSRSAIFCRRRVRNLVEVNQ